jgi:acyl transferase domain-containing protein
VPKVPTSAPELLKMPEARIHGSWAFNDTRVNEVTREFDEIAIVGMAMRLPGGIRTSEALWKLLAEKRSTRCKVPSDRFNVSTFYSPSGRLGSMKTEYGHFLATSDSLYHLDTSMFSMVKKEVEVLDPQAKMLLEVVYECMQNGGQVKWRGGDIGCFVGVFGEVSCNTSNSKKLS